MPPGLALLLAFVLLAVGVWRLLSDRLDGAAYVLAGVVVLLFVYPPEPPAVFAIPPAVLA